MARDPDKLVIKICGIRDEDNLQHALGVGATAIGLMQVSSSPRYIEPEVAASHRCQIAEHNKSNNKVAAVMVVANQEKDEIQKLVNIIQPDIIQFHGDESEEFCLSFDTPYIKAIQATSAEAIRDKAAKYPSASYILLDTPCKMLGGSGEVFDWDRIPLELSNKLIIAGGLNPTNVSSLLQMVNPAGVDVSSGVEDSPGNKSQQLITEFVAAVSSATKL